MQESQTVVVSPTFVYFILPKSSMFSLAPSPPGPLDPWGQEVVLAA